MIRYSKGLGTIHNGFLTPPRAPPPYLHIFILMSLNFLMEIFSQISVHNYLAKKESFPTNLATDHQHNLLTKTTYGKVLSTSLSRLEAHDCFFRLSMKGKFDVYTANVYRALQGLFLFSLL